MKTYRTAIVGILTLCLTLLCQQANAQTGRFYSTDTGLTSSLVNQLYQDSKGFVWMATEYGLSRFDGIRFTNYYHRSSDSTSIRNNYVRCLYEDSSRNLMVGCIDGLMKYDRETNSFAHIPMMRGGREVFPHVTLMCKLSNGEIWISTTGQGMFRLDEPQGIAYSLDHALREANYNYQSCFYEDGEGNIWIGTYGQGVICHTPSTGEIRTFKHSSISDNNVYAIQEDGYGNLFIGTQKQGLFRYERAGQRFVSVEDTEGELISVYCLLNVDGKMLVGTDGQGMKIYNTVKDRLESYHDAMSPRDFSKGKIHAIMTDRDKNLWLALFQKGIIMLPKVENQFEYAGNKSIFDNPIGQACVMSIYQDSRHHLWVGADNEGLYELDAEGHRIRHLKPDESAHSVANTVMCIYEDSDRHLWIGSYTRGVAILDRKSGQCTYPLPIDNEKIFSITEDKQKNLYIATLGSGFYRYNLRTAMLDHFESAKDEAGDLTRNELPNDWLNCLFVDSEGLIWIGHYKGISCFNPRTDSFVNYNGVNTLITGCVGYALMEDNEGRIWAGTSEGLYRFNKQDGAVRHYTTDDGLPNNVICGLSTDTRHHIWLSTYRGICCFDANSETFINYYAGDGLQGNEFTHGAFFRTTDGKIYFGGVDGITGFYPQSITGVNKTLNVSITEFYMAGKPIHRNSLSGGKHIINCAVEDANTFTLTHADNTFSLIFSTLEYKSPEQITYQYRMEELSHRWMSTEPGVSRVTYNNLPPGTYTFAVRAMSHGVYSDPRTVRIIILPPWYATRWAYVIYVLITALLIWGGISILIARARHKRELMKREHTEQLNEAKLQFFINISHEIRTPMTLIINPLEKLIADSTEDGLRPTYLMIYRNAKRILRLINQLMDIRKLDKGQMYLKCRETDLVGFIADVMQTFEYPARGKNIRFSFRHDMEELKVWIDLNNFDKVLMNILSNAFKYTPDGGEIEISLSTGSNPERYDALREYFEIVVTDSGIGIDPGEIERIFERFYQVDNQLTKVNFGTGIGLHLSRSIVELHHGIIFAEQRTDGTGSRFVIRLPMGSTHLRADELEQQGSLTTPHSSVVPMHNELNAEETTLSLAHTDFDQITDTLAHNQTKPHQHILIVEDEGEIREYLKHELAANYRIDTCTNGKEAYQYILREMPDLVISDVMMPEMDGLTLCSKLKQNTNINHIPVVLLTAKTRMEDTLEGMAHGADAYLTKPFSTELLKSTLANLLSNRRLLRNKFSGLQQQAENMEPIKVQSNDEMLMNRVMKVVNEHIGDPEFTVELLAEQVGLSRVHLHRKLKELTNLSTRDFIKNIRLQQAARLLRQDKHLSVSDVAYAIGYSNLSHFSNSFKEKYGVTPTAYSCQEKDLEK